MKVFHSFCDSVTLVAPGVAATRPAWLKIAPDALVSPEKVGPTRPRIDASSIICGAIALVFCGSDSVSKGLRVTWQPGLAALC